MKKFTFRLEKVLRWKEQVELQKKRELAQEVALEIQLVQKLENLEERLSRFRHSPANRRRGVTTAGSWVMYQEQIQLLEKHRRRAEQELSGQHGKVAAKRRELARASREKKLLEALRERRLEEYREETRRRELLLMNETAVNGWQRNRMEG